MNVQVPFCDLLRKDFFLGIILLVHNLTNDYLKLRRCGLLLCLGSVCTLWGGKYKLPRTTKRTYKVLTQLGLLIDTKLCVCVFVFGATAPSGPGRPYSRGF